MTKMGLLAVALVALLQLSAAQRSARDDHGRPTDDQVISNDVYTMPPSLRPKRNRIKIGLQQPGVRKENEDGHPNDSASGRYGNQSLYIIDETLLSSKNSREIIGSTHSTSIQNKISKNELPGSSLLKFDATQELQYGIGLQRTLVPPNKDNNNNRSSSVPISTQSTSQDTNTRTTGHVEVQHVLRDASAKQVISIVASVPNEKDLKSQNEGIRDDEKNFAELSEAAGTQANFSDLSLLTSEQGKVYGNFLVETHSRSTTDSLELIQGYVPPSREEPRLHTAQKTLFPPASNSLEIVRGYLPPSEEEGLLRRAEQTHLPPVSKVLEIVRGYLPPSEEEPVLSRGEQTYSPPISNNLEIVRGYLPPSEEEPVLPRVEQTYLPPMSGSLEIVRGYLPPSEEDGLLPRAEQTQLPPVSKVLEIARGYLPPLEEEPILSTAEQTYSPPISNTLEIVRGYLPPSEEEPVLSRAEQTYLPPISDNLEIERDYLPPPKKEPTIQRGQQTYLPPVSDRLEIVRGYLPPSEEEPVLSRAEQSYLPPISGNLEIVRGYLPPSEEEPVLPRVEQTYLPPISGSLEIVRGNLPPSKQKPVLPRTQQNYLPPGLDRLKVETGRSSPASKISMVVQSYLPPRLDIPEIELQGNHLPSANTFSSSRLVVEQEYLPPLSETEVDGHNHLEKLKINRNELRKGEEFKKDLPHFSDQSHKKLVSLNNKFSEHRKSTDVFLIKTSEVDKGLSVISQFNRHEKNFMSETRTSFNRICFSNEDCKDSEVCSDRRCVDGCAAVKHRCVGLAECETRRHTAACTCPARHISVTISSRHGKEHDCMPTARLSVRGKQLLNSGLSRKSPALSVRGKNILKSRAKQLIDSRLNRRRPALSFKGKHFVNSRLNRKSPALHASTSTYSQSHLSPIRGSSGGLRQSGFASASSDDPCRPNPCGTGTRCTVSRTNIAQCRCRDGLVPMGDTIQGCKEQCTSDFECSDSQRCRQNKCESVCGPGACAHRAECTARNHKARCTCPEGFSGRAEVGCTKETPVLRAEPPAYNFNPCDIAPCAPQADCRVDGDRAVCSCPRGYGGDALTNCFKHECIDHDDCQSSQACKDNTCIDPCQSRYGYCAQQATCEVRNHNPVCSCPAGHRGNALERCIRLTPRDYCEPTPCGKNTECSFNGERAVCKCLKNHFGDPVARSGCDVECRQDRECGRDQQCFENRCVNPCAYDHACGENAFCNVANHIISCECPEYYQGDPRTRCTTECTLHDDCTSQLACIKFECKDPCEGACGTNADCKVRDHKAVCSCPRDHTGHPFDACRPFTDADLCEPNNPCGTSAICTPGVDASNNPRPVCSCPEGYIGNPTISCVLGDCRAPRDCLAHQTCYGYECQDACVTATGSVCGLDADCKVNSNHEPVCSCRPGYEGDALDECRPLTRNSFRAGRF